jgi:general secretion pathway protein G
MRRKRHVRKSFTLVELLIVIVIIGILAAVAMPQFGDASQDAKLAALDQNLATVRSAIELYHYQHGSYPGTAAKHQAALAEAQKNHASTADAFTKQLTLYSDAAGNTSGEKSSSYPYGPYLKRQLPANPLPAAGVSEAAADNVNVTTDTTALAADANPTTGWKASSETGEFIANNAAYDDR